MSVEFFKKNVLDKQKLSKLLSVDTFIAFENWVNNKIELDKDTLKEIIDAIKNWAISLGATNYSHWFQPLGGKTAEKHTSFLSFDKNNNPISKLTFNNLIFTETDGSSFPSGGLRNSFEARGYITWDSSSPFFILENNNIKTLCIPSIFVTYNGESLDQKLPLLRSESILNKKTTELLNLLGKNVKYVYSTIGLEQEYFLIDAENFEKRDDIKMLGKTLFGIKSPKTQQLQDQYFGVIKSKVLNFMEDLENEAHKCGIPISTRHNEVAPNQFEFAPIFETANLANDHNQLLMILLNNIAEKHNFVCLLNEKPFQEVNGSGKHLNWSLSDSDGNNLLQFKEDNIEETLLFISIVIQAVYDHNDILLSSVAVSGNDARLGGFEAPPSILSIFLGDFVSTLFKKIENNGKVSNLMKKELLSTSREIHKIFKDNSDRNRTSPFAFTGNKFEFRMVGSSQNIATPATILNTIVVDSIDKTIIILKKYITKKKNIKEAIFSTIKDILKRTNLILFDGDGYSKEWEMEAKKRGLYIQKNLLVSLKELVSDKNIKLFKKYNILSENELYSRYLAWTNLYLTNKKIEVNVMLEIIDNKIIPDVLSYKTFLLTNIKLSSEILDKNLFTNENKLLSEYSKLINELFNEKEELLKIKEEYKNKKELDAINFVYKYINPQLIKIRKILDELEKKTGDKYWSLPKYKEFLFY